jgi:hypothetical protein
MAAIFARRVGGLLGIELPQQHRWAGMPEGDKDSGLSGEQL